MNYLSFLQKGLRQVVKSALLEFAAGRNYNHYFFIMFKTQYPGVRISLNLRQQYQEEMTIILQHDFYNLVVADEYLSVDLYFSNIKESIVIPFDAIYKFEDPVEPFILDFIVDMNGDMNDDMNDDTTGEYINSLKINNEIKENCESAEDFSTIIELDKFRK